MSLLPRALQFRDEALSLPLGAAKVKPAAVKVDPIKVFEDYEASVTGKDGYSFFITEADCRQIKGAAQETDRPSGEASTAQARRSPVAASPSTEKPPFKVGDRVKAIYSHYGLMTVVGVCSHVSCIQDDDDGQSMAFQSDELVLIHSEPKEADGWVEWKGGECPAPPETLVVVKFRHGRENAGGAKPAWHWIWSHGKCEYAYEIVAYRLVKQQ